MATLSKLTKAQLIEHIVMQDAKLRASAAECAQLRELVQRPAPVAAQYVAPVDMHKAYYDYVRNERTTQRAAGYRVCTYKSFSQWSEQFKAPLTLAEQHAAELDAATEHYGAPWRSV